MFHFRRVAAVFALAASVTACSVHPLPEDATGLDTVRLVSKVRCEVRDAIRDYVIGALQRRADYVGGASPYAALVTTLSDPENWKYLRRWLKLYPLDPDTHLVFERYNHSAIIYEFTFDISEKNTAGIGADLLGTLTRGTVKINLGASTQLTRDNVRTFRVADNFENLVTYVDEEYCSGPLSGTSAPTRQHPNLVYPITGSLKLHELIGTFLNLNQSGNLIGPATPAQEVEFPTIIESMDFTTKFTGGATPTLELNPRPPGLSLTKASLSLANEREDLHKLRIVLKLPPEYAIEPRTIAERRAAAALLARTNSTNLSQAIRVLAVEDLDRAVAREFLEEGIRLRKQVRGLLLD